MRARLDDPDDPRLRVAVEDGGVLGIGDLRGGVDQGLELGIFRALLDRIQLVARQLEVRAQLDQGQLLAPGRLDSGRRRRINRPTGGPSIATANRLAKPASSTPPISPGGAPA